MLKKLAITVVVFVILIAGVAVALPKIVPFAKVQDLVKDKVREATGRELDFKSARLVFFPDIAVALEEASLSNASWAKDKNMVEVGRLDVALALAPLFEKRVEVRSLILKSPVIHLEKNKDGKGSWEMTALKKAAAEPAASAPEKPAAPAAAQEGDKAQGGMPFKFRIGDIRIVDGLFTYADRAAGTEEKLEKVDITIVMPDLDSPLKIDGALGFRGKSVAFVLGLERPVAMLNGTPSPGSLKLKTDVMSATVAGTLATGGTLLKGSIDADISSLSALAAWAGGGERKELPFSRVTFKSDAEATATRLKLSGAKLNLDEVEAQGDVTVDVAGKPDITMRAKVASKLKLDRFTGEVDTGGAEGMASALTPPPPKKKAEAGGWDAKPIDFSGLKSVNADLILDTQGFSLKGAEVGPSRLTVQLKDGVLDASSSEATLFGGAFSSALRVNSAAATPNMAFTFGMKGVDAKPVLTTFAKFDKLSGKADADVDVTATGQSEKQIIESLAGKGAVIFRNGALEGIDLVNIAKMVQSKLAKMNVGAGKTEFVDLGGTFTVTGGVVNNQDFKMRGPLVQATGAGTVDLPKKYLNYRVTPVLTASSGEDNASGLSVPVDIRGPFSDISVLPDYKSVINDALKDPEKLRKQAGEIADQAQKGIKELQKDPEKAIQNILGAFGQ